MKYLIFPLVTLGLGTAAMAQPPSVPKSYPPCSKSVTDECMGSSREGHHATMGPAHHKMAVHHARKAAHHRKMVAHHRARHMAHAAHHGKKAHAKSS